MTDTAGTTSGDRDPGLPERFGPYRVEGLIGAGGMGMVYRALDDALQRQVALKTLVPALAADPEFVARFKREAQSAAALNHPNITQIYAIGQEGMIPFFAMELIHGASLDALVREKGPFGPPQAAAYIIQAAQGLRHAHLKGLIHRDVKPSNLMLTDDGVVKITDFGLAKAARSETRLTTTGQVLGSPGYISPEQAQGGEIDARSDIYSLGATFYHIVTGKLPFDAPTPVAMIIKHMNEPLRSPRALNPSIPYPIAAIIQKMMAKRPGERFQDYDALLRDLERAVSSLPETAAPVAAGLAVPGRMPARPGAGGRAAGSTARLATTGRTTPPTIEPDASSSGGWLLKVVAITLIALVAVGVLKHLRARREGPPLTAGALHRPGGGEGTQVASSIETEGTFTSHPAFATAGGEPQAGAGIEERLRERFRRRNRPSLTFVSNDHEVLPDGRLKVIGRIQNVGGGVATQVRVRVSVLLDDGTLAARGETPLVPSTVRPGESANFELPINYTGPVGIIKAELVWVE